MRTDAGPYGRRGPVKLCECGCGAPIAQPRGGSRPKRFATGACRARWNRNRKRDGGATPAAAPTDDERGRTLARLYESLKTDVARLGTLLDTETGPKANPSAALLLRVLVELDRREADRAAVERKEVDDGDDIGATLRSVS